VIRLVTGILILDLLLIFPNHPGAATPEALLLMPWELPVLLLALAFVPARLERLLVWAIGLLLALAMLVKCADLLSNLSIGRPFSFILDGFLLSAAWQLGVGNFGVIATAAVVLVIVLLVCGIGLGAVWAARQASRTRGAAMAGAAMLVLFGAAAAAHGLGAMQSRTAAFTSHVILDHARYVRDGLEDIRHFEDAASRDAFAAVPAARVLAGLRGHDVLLTFVESLGRTNLDNPLYAATTRQALAALQSTVAARGLAVRSAWLTSPVMGGGSWYAHETLMSGLKIGNQTRYDALLASPRLTLLDFFAKAGWDTVAVVPGITMAWPEGRKLGFERIYDAAHLGYRGLPFNWVTMPDQFTLAQLYRLELVKPDRPPVFAVTALLSSHAPWTPIPQLVPWDAVGDGTVFNEQARQGDAPEVVWRDPDRVRDQFRKAIDYSLRALDAFVASKLGPQQVLIFLGDHQPAPLVAGANAGHDVPIVIIGPPDVLAALDGWGWTPGTIPADDAPVWLMQDFRDRFLAAYTSR
jgi:hypothetical protein